MAGDLEADTRLSVDPERPGRYRAALGPAWSYVLPSGGVLMSVALRAAREHLAEPAMHLVSATTIFCDPIPEGPLVVDVTVLRRGTSGAQVRAHLAHAEGEAFGLELSATFLRERPGPDVQPLRMPDVPLPEAAIPYEGHGRWRFTDNFRIAQAIGAPTWRKGWQKGEAHQAFWHRYEIPPRAEDGSLDPIAIPPIADTMPGALVRHLGPEAGPIYAPSLDLTVYFVAQPRSEWLLVESRCPVARAGWGIGQAWIWDEEGRLVAMASQGMFLRSGRPPRAPR